MEYKVKELAQKYIQYLEDVEFEVNFKPSTYHNYSAYNEYRYRKMMKEYDKVFDHCDSIEITEHFLKGD